MATYAATLWMLLLAGQVYSEDRSMNLEKIEYLVGDLPEQPQQLIVTRDMIRYESHSNVDRPASLGIGVFERSPSKGEIETIASEIDPVSFRSLPDHQGQVLSGDRWKRIRLTLGGETVDKLVGTKLPVNPALQRVIDRLNLLVDEMTRHPRNVLQISLQDATLDRNGEFLATITLTGAGERKVLYRPPEAQLGSQNGAMVLYWWPYSPNAPKSNVESTRSIAVSQLSLAKIHGALATYRIRSRLEGISPGSYVVQVQYSNMAPKWDAFDVLVGHLFSTPTVVRMNGQLVRDPAQN